MANRSGMLLADEEDALRTLVCELPSCPVIVNIGWGLGYSAAAMLDERRDAVIFSIDINPGDTRKRVIRLLGRSQDIGLHWPSASVEMVYVDGSHLLPDVREDIRVWLPTVKPNGIIALHDHSPPKPRRQTARQLEKEGWVTQAAGELLAGCEVALHVNRLKAFRQKGWK